MADDMTLSIGADVPEVLIEIGYSLPGWFEFTLWDPQGKTSQLIGTGPYSSSPHKFRIGNDVSALDQHLLGWRVTVGAISNDTEEYRVAITVMQNGKPVQNGEYVRSGDFQGGKAVYDHARLIVQ